MTNFAKLDRNGVPLQMLWFCGGHGVCSTDPSDGSRIEQVTVAWMRRWLAGETTVDTGPRFEWIADDGQLRSAADFPLASGGTLTGESAGVLPLSPGDSAGGAAIAAAPAANAFRVPVTSPSAAQLVGDPKLSLSYKGTGSGTTHVYAQLVDRTRGVVVGNQATPVPITLDGKDQTIERPLEPIASSAGAGARYELELIPGISVSGPQRSAGALQIAKARIELPVADAAATKPPAAASGPGAGSAPGAAAGRKINARLRLGRVRVRGRRVTISVSSRATLRGVRVVARSGRRTVGRSRAVEVTGRRSLRLTLAAGFARAACASPPRAPTSPAPRWLRGALLSAEGRAAAAASAEDAATAQGAGTAASRKRDRRGLRIQSDERCRT